MPRVLGVALSTFCLTIVFIFVAFASGFLFAAWTGKGSRDLFLFADTVSRAVQPKDVLNILAKSIFPALFASASWCIGGLGVGRVGCGNSAGHATRAHPLSRRLVRHFSGGFAADIPYDHELKPTDIPELHAAMELANDLEQRFKVRRVNEITGTFVLVIIALLVAGVVWTGRSQRWFKSNVTLRITLPEAGAAGSGRDRRFTFWAHSWERSLTSWWMNRAACRPRQISAMISSCSCGRIRRRSSKRNSAWRAIHFLKSRAARARPLPEKNASIVCNEQYQSALEAAVEDVPSRRCSC